MNCAGGSRNATRMRSNSWWIAIRSARIGLHTRCLAMKRTHATSHRTPSSGSTRPQAGSMEDRGFRLGSIESWSTCASTIRGVIDGGGDSRRSRLQATNPTISLSIRPRKTPAPKAMQYSSSPSAGFVPHSTGCRRSNVPRYCCRRRKDSQAVRSLPCSNAPRILHACMCIAR